MFPIGLRKIYNKLKKKILKYFHKQILLENTIFNLPFIEYYQK